MKMRKLPPPHLLDPLPDGSVCKLGLCEGRLPNAKIWGHQVEGGAGASRHPLHSLQGASQRVHVKGRASCRPSLSGSPLSTLSPLSLLSPPKWGRWRLGPLPPLMSLVRHTTMWSGGDSTQTAIQIFGKKKALLPLLRIVFHSNYGSLLYYFLLW